MFRFPALLAQLLFFLPALCNGSRNSTLARAVDDLATNQDGTDGGAQLLKSLSELDAPSPLSRQNADEPSSAYVSAACRRDFNALCPQHFVILPGTSRCIAGPKYVGPCTGTSYSFDGLSKAGKVRWSEKCMAYWPCHRCAADYADACPSEWTVVDSKSRKCEAPATYSGLCVRTVSFQGFNKEMLEYWSTFCGAHWRCDSSALVDAK